jgi:hypothetical protein
MFRSRDEFPKGSQPPDCRVRATRAASPFAWIFCRAELYSQVAVEERSTGPVLTAISTMTLGAVLSRFQSFPCEYRNRLGSHWHFQEMVAPCAPIEIHDHCEADQSETYRVLRPSQNTATPTSAGVHSEHVSHLC